MSGLLRETFENMGLKNKQQLSDGSTPNSPKRTIFDTFCEKAYSRQLTGKQKEVTLEGLLEAACDVYGSEEKSADKTIQSSLATKQPFHYALVLVKGYINQTISIRPVNLIKHLEKLPADQKALTAIPKELQLFFQILANLLIKASIHPNRFTDIANTLIKYIPDLKITKTEDQKASIANTNTKTTDTTTTESVASTTPTSQATSSAPAASSTASPSPKQGPATQTQQPPTDTNTGNSPSITVNNASPESPKSKSAASSPRVKKLPTKKFFHTLKKSRVLTEDLQKAFGLSGDSNSGHALTALKKFKTENSPKAPKLTNPDRKYDAPPQDKDKKVSTAATPTLAQYLKLVLLVLELEQDRINEQQKSIVKPLESSESIVSAGTQEPAKAIDKLQERVSKRLQNKTVSNKNQLGDFLDVLEVLADAETIFAGDTESAGHQATISKQFARLLSGLDTEVVVLTPDTINQLKALRPKSTTNEKKAVDPKQDKASKTEPVLTHKEVFDSLEELVDPTKVDQTKHLSFKAFVELTRYYLEKMDDKPKPHGQTQLLAFFMEVERLSLKRREDLLATPRETKENGGPLTTALNAVNLEINKPEVGSLLKNIFKLVTDAFTSPLFNAEEDVEKHLIDLVTGVISPDQAKTRDAKELARQAATLRKQAEEQVKLLEAKAQGLAPSQQPSDSGSSLSQVTREDIAKLEEKAKILEAKAHAVQNPDAIIAAEAAAAAAEQKQKAEATAEQQRQKMAEKNRQAWKNGLAIFAASLVLSYTALAVIASTTGLLSEAVVAKALSYAVLGSGWGAALGALAVAVLLTGIGLATLHAVTRVREKEESLPVITSLKPQHLLASSIGSKPAAPINVAANSIDANTATSTPVPTLTGANTN